MGRIVSISSPSSEGGGVKGFNTSTHALFVSISSPSSEGGGTDSFLCRAITMFPLVLLQAKVVGSQMFFLPITEEKVSISSPSSEGGGDYAKAEVKASYKSFH